MDANMKATPTCRSHNKFLLSFIPKSNHNYFLVTVHMKPKKIMQFQNLPFEKKNYHDTQDLER